MKLYKIIPIVLFLIVLFLGSLYYLFFRTSAYFVHRFDGNDIPRQIPLSKKYYYYETDSSLYYQIERGTFKRITKSKVDSLNWNSNIIFGYSKSKYFVVDVNTEIFNVYDSRDSLMNKYSKFYTDTFRVLKQVPGVKIK